MQIHADLSEPATVDGTMLAWVPSPIPGVERRMLERDGDEVARATSLVRYAPGSSFSPHTHGAGEEFLVLKGVFSDESGNFPAGSYVRNPPGSAHAPSSGPGALIFVKLRQMPAEERRPVCLDARDPALWRDLGAGLSEAVLFEAPWEQVVMLKLAPSGRSGSESWPRGVELFVVEGDLEIDGVAYGPETWLRRPAGSALAMASAGGALVYRKSGHLG